MTAAALRSLTLAPVSARAPVVVEVATPAGPVPVALTGHRYEPVYEPGPPDAAAPTMPGRARVTRKPGPRPNCLHCRRNPSRRGKRGLCHYCYAREPIRRLHPTRVPHRVWTALERAAVLRMKAAGEPAKVIAARLGRPVHQVHSAFERWRVGVKRHRPRAETLAAITRFNRLGWTDAEIATEIGAALETVRRYRRQIGLPHRREPDPALCRCWGCNRPCPSRSRPAAVGWHSRRLPLEGVQVSCPDCYARHGWGEVA